MITPKTIKFPTLQKIDYTKYIQPMKVEFIKINSINTIAILVPIQ